MLFQNRKHVVILRCVIGAVFLVLLILAIVEIASPGKKSDGSKDTQVAQGNDSTATGGGPPKVEETGTLTPTEPGILPASATKDPDSKLDNPNLAPPTGSETRSAGGGAPPEPPGPGPGAAPPIPAVPFKDSLKSLSVQELMKLLDTLRAKKIELDTNEKDTMEMIKTRLAEQKQAVSELEKELKKKGIENDVPPPADKPKDINPLVDIPKSPNQ